MQNHKQKPTLLHNTTTHLSVLQKLHLVLITKVLPLSVSQKGPPMDPSMTKTTQFTKYMQNTDTDNALQKLHMTLISITHFTNDKTHITRMKLLLWSRDTPGFSCDHYILYKSKTFNSSS